MFFPENHGAVSHKLTGRKWLFKAMARDFMDNGTALE